MKCVFIIFGILFLNINRAKSKAELISLNLNYNITNQDFSNLIYDHYKNRTGGITAVINDFADKIFGNIKYYMIRNGLDPVEIPDETLKLFPTGRINLTNGWLQDTSTIAKYNDVIVTYRSSMKKVIFTVPVRFDSLMFIYKYNTKILLLNAAGDVQGKVTNVKANIRLSFDFDKYVASLDKLDITDTGRISLTFSGNGIIDWITSTTTSVLSLFLHPIIIRIIQVMIKGGLDGAVAVVNETIQEALNN